MAAKLWCSHEPKTFPHEAWLLWPSKGVTSGSLWCVHPFEVALDTLSGKAVWGLVWLQFKQGAARTTLSGGGGVGWGGGMFLEALRSLLHEPEEGEVEGEAGAVGPGYCTGGSRCGEQGLRESLERQQDAADGPVLLKLKMSDCFGTFTWQKTGGCVGRNINMHIHRHTHTYKNFLKRTCKNRWF